MSASGVRPWVQRLGSYLRIFGARPTLWYGRTHAEYVDQLADLAQKREAEFESHKTSRDASEDG